MQLSLAAGLGCTNSYNISVLDRVCCFTLHALGLPASRLCHVLQVQLALNMSLSLSLCLLQPMTILMTRVCMSPVFAQAAAAAAGIQAGSSLTSSSSSSSSSADLSGPTSMASMADGSSRVPVGAAFAVVIASNVAANFTVMGALAGIMFVNILQRKGLRTVNYATFSRLMLPSGLVSAVLALSILGAELVLWQ
jgi:hypothetical protein